MTIRILLTFIIIIYSSGAFSTKIRVLDFQQLIENNTHLLLLYKKIEQDQKSYKEQFNNEEINLENEYQRIEKLKLILDSSELEKEIEIYNLKLKKFNETIAEFNLHYDKQINNLKNNLINILLDLLKKYSEENKIDLILDSNNYILSSNSINITNLIKDLVSKQKIEISFEKF